MTSTAILISFLGANLILFAIGFVSCQFHAIMRLIAERSLGSPL